MNKERVKEAVEMMTLICAGHRVNNAIFDMTSWRRQSNECGTSACFGGHLALRNPEHLLLIPCDNNDSDTYSTVHHAVSEEEEGYSAVKEFLDISDDAAFILCHGMTHEMTSDITAEMQLERVKFLYVHGEDTFVATYKGD